MVYLVRHGEVHNPDHVVYADLPGFGLGTRGRAQAEAAADHLAGLTVAALVTSPLRRAVETTNPIASALGVAAQTDERLTEWRLGQRWAGVVWEDLHSTFPGELEAYLDHPHDLPFAPESIDQVAARVVDLIECLGRRHPGEAAVIVSHQDPIQAARLRLTGRPLTELQTDKPQHVSVITLEAGSPWCETDVWVPKGGSEVFPPIPTDPAA
jgi:broad specificity phosphatase PhoE